MRGTRAGTAHVSEARRFAPRSTHPPVRVCYWHTRVSPEAFPYLSCGEHRCLGQRSQDSLDFFACLGQPLRCLEDKGDPALLQSRAQALRATTSELSGVSLTWPPRQRLSWASQQVLPQIRLKGTVEAQPFTAMQLEVAGLKDALAAQAEASREAKSASEAQAKQLQEMLRLLAKPEPPGSTKVVEGEASHSTLVSPGRRLGV